MRVERGESIGEAFRIERRSQSYLAPNEFHFNARTTLLSTLLAAALLDPLGLLVRTLPTGALTPNYGSACAGSYSTLGATVGQGTPRRTTIVNVWFVRRDNESLGWILKTLGGAYWYEDPGSAYYEQITAVNAGELRQRGIGIGGCFKTDLSI